MKPSKKIVALLIVALALVASLSILALKRGAKSAPAEPTIDLVSATETREAFTETDSDNDGLKDWEEILWQTSSQNRDTDRDGTSDGEEVAAGRNPSVAGPNDTLNISAPTESETGVKTDTSEFSRTFFGNYLKAKQSGKSLNPDAIIEATLETSVPSIEAKIYTLAQLKTSQVDNAESIRAYGNLLGKIMIENSPKQLENELIIAYRAATTENKDELKKLEPIIEAYRKILDELIKMPVPKSALSYHLLFVNSISQVTTTIEGMNMVFVDPVRALVSIGQYLEHAQALANSYAGLVGYFKNQNVIFTQQEHGYLWSNTI
ncbi:MAG: thrombospondin type 3 repeat-containing protein [bacterium]|nr:thrombospondin type 3 repeat-containing protein [bacterium]